MVDNGTWKKGVLGNGHASKEEIAAYATKVLGIPLNEPQDVYDAACIAEFGRRNR
jgi:Holliday junction resolvasome RuvABC endonuclease subunit